MSKFSDKLVAWARTSHEVVQSEAGNWEVLNPEKGTYFVIVTREGIQPFGPFEDKDLPVMENMLRCMGVRILEVKKY